MSESEPDPGDAIMRQCDAIMKHVPGVLNTCHELLRAHLIFRINVTDMTEAGANDVALGHLCFIGGPGGAVTLGWCVSPGTGTEHYVLIEYFVDGPGPGIFLR